MQHPASIPFLTLRLQDPKETAIVRHECAEALGSIANEECEEVLKRFMHDAEEVVKDSCKVALDMLEYENNNTQFQFVE
jgi:deoxyhypusine monooxygenase